MAVVDSISNEAFRSPKGMSSMRPIRSIATALLIAGLAVAGCAKSQPNQNDTTATQPPPVTKAPPVNRPTPSVGKTPVAAPRILSVTTSPALSREGGFLVLPAGAGTVTFHVRAVNTQRVRFLLGPTGTEVRDLAKLLGEDRDDRDGWTVTWRYKDEALMAYLYVSAIGPGGTSPETILSLYHPEPAA